MNKVLSEVDGDTIWNDPMDDDSPDQAAKEELDKILEPLIPVLQDGDVYVAALRAALLALMHRETVAIADEVEKVNDSNGRYNACVEFREAAAKRYGQKEEHIHEADDNMLYTSNPPKYRCKTCGELFTLPEPEKQS